jgi:hypothetical protein
MENAIKQIAPDVWRVDIAGAVRIIRYRLDSRTFEPWDICAADGRRLWASDSLESAFRWRGTYGPSGGGTPGGVVA